MSSVGFGIHWSGKLMEGNANLLGVIKWLKVPFDIVNNRKRKNGNFAGTECRLFACCNSHKVVSKRVDDAM
jgi:hypothetical protein